MAAPTRSASRISGNTKTTNDLASSTGSSGGTASATNGGKATNINNGGNTKSVSVSTTKTNSSTHSNTTSATGGSDQSPGLTATKGGTATAVAADGTGPGQWLSANDHSKINATNKDVGNTTTNTTTKSDSSTNVNILASLKNSVIGSGSLSQTTTNSITNTTSAAGGSGSAFNTATVSGNRSNYAAVSAGQSGNVSMSELVGGQGILQANLNTGANAVQQNSVALTSTVGGNGGGLNGFSPNTITPSVAPH